MSANSREGETDGSDDLEANEVSEDSDDSEDDDDNASPRTRQERTMANTPLGRLEQSTPWQSFIIGVIVLNTAVLAMQADNPDPAYWDVIDNIFLNIFVVELALRLTVYGCSFFTNHSWGWNWFDLFVVMMGVLDQWLLSVIFGEGNQQMSKVFSSFRTIRLLRVLRAVRLFKQFKELNRLMVGLVSSVRSVIWIAVLFFILIFTSSIFVTSMVGKAADMFEDPEKIDFWFGTITRSMVTLSIFVTCDDWSTPARMVNQVYGSMVYFWIWYIVMGAFLILSLLTGLMADQMMEAREEESEEGKGDPNELDQQVARFGRYLQASNSSMDFKTFETLVKKPKMAAALERCGLRTEQPSERQWLFNSLDRDDDKSLTLSEVRDAFRQIGANSAAEGSVSPLEVMKLEGRIVRLDRMLQQADSSAFHDDPSGSPSWDHRLDVVHGRVALLSERLHILQADIMDFFHHLGFQPAQA